MHLIIETSSSTPFIAIEENGQYSHICFIDQSEIATSLHSSLKQLFIQVGKPISQVTSITCSKGPGSFTGMRIGIVTAKTFSFIYKIDLFSFPSLIFFIPKDAQSGHIVIDAKSNRVYCMQFSIHEDSITYSHTSLLSVEEIEKKNNVYSPDEKLSQKYPSIIQINKKDISPKWICKVQKEDSLKSNPAFEPLYIKKPS